MKHKCPKCGHRFEDNAQQSKAAKARWNATSAEDRSSAASAAAQARWKTKKAAPGQSKVGIRDAPGTPNRKHSMPTKTKTSSKRNAKARSSLARGSDFCTALNRAIKFHRESKEDPHGINNAVWVALTEVRDALRYALNK